MTGELKNIFHICWSYIAGQPWEANLHTLFFMLLALVVLPVVVVYVVYWVARLNHIQMGRTFGNDSKVVVGGIGNILHELESLVMARIGGHSLRNVTFRSLADIRQFKSVADVSHNWMAYNKYEAMCDFLIGAVPVYATGTILWGIQSLLGGNTFHPTVCQGFFDFKQMESTFFGSLPTAFSAGNFLERILLFLVVILIGSTAFALSWDEVRRVTGGAILWGVFLMIIWAVLVLCSGASYITNGLWFFTMYSAFLLAHILVYLIVILIIVSVLHVFNHIHF